MISMDRLALGLPIADEVRHELRWGTAALKRYLFVPPVRRPNWRFPSGYPVWLALAAVLAAILVLMPIAGSSAGISGVGDSQPDMPALGMRVVQTHPQAAMRLVGGLGGATRMPSHPTDKGLPISVLVRDWCPRYQ